MNTRNIESKTNRLPASAQLNRTGIVSRFTEIEPLIPDGPELWRLYQQRAGSNTENALVEYYLPLVCSISNQLSETLPDHVDRDDLHSAGLLGLLAALRKFNPASRVPFKCYARLRIRGAMLDEMRRMDWVPRVIHQKSKRVKTIIGQMEQQLGRAPTRTEAADAMNISVAQYDKLLGEIRLAQLVPLDVTSGEEDEMSLSDIIAYPDQIDPLEQVSARELAQVIFERLQEMPEIQRKVLTLYYVEGMYLREISDALGLTDGRICQIQAQAINSLRSYLKRYENGMASPDEPALPMKQRGGKKQTVQSQAGTGHFDSTISPATGRRAA